MFEPSIQEKQENNEQNIKNKLQNGRQADRQCTFIFCKMNKCTEMR